MLSDYRKFVCLKAAPPRALPSLHFELLHVALGLSTEILELHVSSSRKNTVEELEDILWYSVYGTHVLGVPVEALPLEIPYSPKDNVLSLDRLIASIEEFASLVKKHVIYGVDQSLLPQKAFMRVWESFLYHCSACNTTLPLLIQGNRTKLEKRYAAAFTATESEQRKDKEEE